MTFERIIRWGLLPLGILVQWVVMLLTPFVWPLLKLYQGRFRPYDMMGDIKSPRAVSLQHIMDHPQPMLRDEVFYADYDDHNALNHMHLWHFFPKLALKGLPRLQYENGAIKRITGRRVESESFQVSGDAVVGFTAAHLDSSTSSVPIGIEMLADHIIANAFGVESRKLSGTKGVGVSTRGSWCGLNFSFDGALHLAPICFGPQVWTCLSVLGYAASGKKFKYKFWYWFYFILFGAWFWAFYPLLFLPKKRDYSVDHVSVLALWVLNTVQPSIFYRRPMRYIVKIHKEWVNPFFYGLLWNCSADSVDVEMWEKAAKVCLYIGDKGFPLMWQHSPESWSTDRRLDRHYVHVNAHAASLLMSSVPSRSLRKGYMQVR